MAGNPIIPFRVSKDMFDWLNHYITDHGYEDRTAFLVMLLTAVKEGRMKIYPRAGVSAFPAIEAQPGVSPEHPLLICFNPTYEE